MAGDAKSETLPRLQAEVFIRAELRKFVRLPELYNMRRAPGALGKRGLGIRERGRRLLVSDQNLRLDAANTGKGRQLLDQIAPQHPVPQPRYDLIACLDRHL